MSNHLHNRIINGLEDDFTRLATKAVIQKDQMQALQSEYLRLLRQSQSLAERLKRIIDISDPNGGRNQISMTAVKENLKNLANVGNLGKFQKLGLKVAI